MDISCGHCGYRLWTAGPLARSLAEDPPECPGCGELMTCETSRTTHRAS